MVPGRWPTLVRACLSTQPLARGTGPLDTVRVLVWCCLQTRRKININGCFYCSISGMERMLWHLLHVQSLKPCWRHQIETFSAFLAICVGNSPVPGEFPAQRPVTQSFDVFFDLRLNKRLSKLWWGWWIETPSCSLSRHCNVIQNNCSYLITHLNLSKCLQKINTQDILR